MSPEDFENLLFTAEPGELRRRLAGLDEKTRRSLSKTAQAAYSSLSRNKPAKAASERVRKFVEKRKGESWEHWNHPVNRRAALALYAVAPLSGLKRSNLFVNGQGPRKAMFGILEDRRPAWLGDWVAWKLDQEFHNLEFERVHGWIKKGLMEKPETPSYYSLLLNSLDVFLWKTEGRGRIKAEEYVPLSSRLRGDPSLLADALSVFKYENRGLLNNSWNTENAHPKYESWNDALIALEASGDLKRSDLLDASLDSLSEDLKGNQLSGNHQFHSHLKPTDNEVFERRNKYRELLTHPIGHIVKFALSYMDRLDKAERMDRSEFLSELPMIFQGAGIGNAKSALRLAARIAKSESALRAPVITAIIPALNHKDAGLQEACLKLIDQYKPELSANHVEEISRAAGFLAPSLRPKALGLIGKQVGEESIQGSEADWQACLEEAKVFPKNIQDAYGVSDLIDNGAFSPSLISEDFRDLRVLHLAQPLSPIENHDALYAAIAKALETVVDATEVELIIDGISRLGRETSANFTQRLDPLLTRIKSGGTETSRGLIQSWNALGHGVVDLVKAWATGTISKRNIRAKYYPHNRAAQPMIAHLNALAHRVVQGTKQIRLSTPTHEGGWIDPRVWVERAKDLIASGQKVDVPDLCYSMLRLAPDFRDEVAIQIDELPNPWRAVGRFLFGLEACPDLSVKTHPFVWLSAARARDPYANWAEDLSDLSLTETAPDGISPAQYAWKTVTTETKPRWSQIPIKTTTYTINVSAKSANGDFPAKAAPKFSFLKRLKPKTVLNAEALPTAALATHLTSNRWDASGWLFEWMTLFWPQNPSSIYARATYAFHLDENASSWSAGHGYLHALFQPNRSWGELGHLVIARGLAAKNADIRGYIIDALIEGSENGQFDPSQLAAILTKMIKAEGVKLGRVADGMNLVAEVSPLHSALISFTLSELLPQLNPKTHAFSKLMELWLETLANSGRGPDPDHQDWLSSFKGASKSTKAAKKIKTLIPNAALDKATKLQALQSRLAVLPLS